MRTKVNLLLVCLMACTIAHAQDNFKLSLKALSLEPDSSKEQIHALVLKNNSSSNLDIELRVENVQCEEKHSSKHSNLEQVFLNKNASKTLNNSIALNANQTLEFSIKITKPKNVTLGSSNCSKVTAKTSGQNPSEQSLTIESYIPDPSKYN